MKLSISGGGDVIVPVLPCVTLLLGQSILIAVGHSIQVRFAPNSDRRADVPAGPSWANRVSSPSRQIRLTKLQHFGVAESLAF